MENLTLDSAAKHLGCDIITQSGSNGPFQALNIASGVTATVAGNGNLRIYFGNGVTVGGLRVAISTPSGQQAQARIINTVRGRLQKAGYETDPPTVGTPTIWLNMARTTDTVASADEFFGSPATTTAAEVQTADDDIPF